MGSCYMLITFVVVFVSLVTDIHSLQVGRKSYYFSIHCAELNL